MYIVLYVNMMRSSIQHGSSYVVCARVYTAVVLVLWFSLLELACWLMPVTTTVIIINNVQIPSASFVCCHCTIDVYLRTYAPYK